MAGARHHRPFEINEDLADLDELSNTLYRHDADTLEACLVDAETSEQHANLSDGQRDYDMELATERGALTASSEMTRARLS